MGSKNKTVSFRVNEDAFEALREIADERDLSLSAVFRDYVDTLVAHDGQVEVVPEHRMEEADGDGESFPPTVEVPKSFVREHERLELEAEHLREQLDEYKAFVTFLQDKLEESDDAEEVVFLEELDGGRDDDEPYQLG
ncbi:ribbon-helix-helix protein, CopG family [Halobaculum lipolyticum]|uniref:Ribbon-helix-helix protein, CopG family n=1 Tax=Halobaculum lipolyticum TaxID=3032001 RepID=A0ABD5WCV1_9EURY|nr:ribbon-helix-helix protein, CopG family [Halobaculum sp. DT31]